MTDTKAVCNSFLAKDKEGFQNPQFRHAEFIVEIMPQLKDGQVFSLNSL